MKDSTIDIDNLFERFNEINDEDNVALIDFVEKHFDFLINFKTDDIEIVEDIASIFNDYYGTLGICNHWTQIELKRKPILDFVQQLKGKSLKYEKHLYDIEYVFATTQTDSGKNIKSAIKSLEKLNEQFPKDEDIILELRKAKFVLRQKTYQRIFILGLILVIGTFLLRLNYKIKELELISVVIWTFFILLILIQKIDNYKSNKSPAANKM